MDYLKRAWRASRLWAQRKSFASCMADPVLRDVLQRHAAALRRMDERLGRRPIQEELAL